MNVIEFARKRLNEEIMNGNEDDYDIRYWVAYLDGAVAQKKEDEREMLKPKADA